MFQYHFLKKFLSCCSLINREGIYVAGGTRGNHQDKTTHTKKIKLCGD
jgi:hypothetical protein